MSGTPASECRQIRIECGSEQGLWFAQLGSSAVRPTSVSPRDAVLVLTNEFAVSRRINGLQLASALDFQIGVSAMTVFDLVYRNTMSFRRCIGVVCLGFSQKVSSEGVCPNAFASVPSFSSSSSTASEEGVEPFGYASLFGYIQVESRANICFNVLLTAPLSGVKNGKSTMRTNSGLTSISSRPSRR